MIKVSMWLKSDNFNSLAGDVDDPTHLSKRVGRGVPGVVVWSLLIVLCCVVLCCVVDTRQISIILLGA